MANHLEKKIIKQIEYYFGDINLPRDKFMQEKVKADDGWIPLEVLLTFKRLASLTTDEDMIINALKKSDHDLVHVSEDSKKLRRNPEKTLPEITEERKKELSVRTAYAKGFPLEILMDDILNFLEPYGPVDSVFKRTYLDKATKQHKFKGSCFIIFKDIETCKKFIEAESIKYNDTELIRKWQTVYLDEKKKEFQLKKRDKKKKKEEENQQEPEEPQKKMELPKGVTLYFSGIKKDQIITREEIKEKIKEVYECDNPYIDFNKGDIEGHVRLSEETPAKEFFEKLTDGHLEIGDIKLQFKVLEGDEETDYLAKTVDIIIKKRQEAKRGGRNKKRRGNFRDGGKKRARYS